jgi:alpha-aminoadipate carrier protein LysW
MNTAECPECAAEVAFKEKPVLHELVRCPECNAELEVVKLEPLTLEPAPTEQEDWGE